ncbi:unnamed protein product [Ceratitis capitata]|uniref:(Mediterranean fruit fly) hypothetical protein n=1 Tax=Ceratitis capitata TaxID=7213 RepID=A0A811UVT3_CERCA|nr:unnamed protein product [Ceratitis capitata]
MRWKWTRIGGTSTRTRTTMLQYAWYATSCNTYMATWSRGSPAFIYPPEVGYPLDTSTVKFIMMETHYNNLNIDFEQFKLNHMFDSSGLRLHVTEQLRQNDAGLMSIGIETNWHHIIPPGQARVGLKAIA